jgi:hypothetical protein
MISMLVVLTVPIASAKKNGHKPKPKAKIPSNGEMFGWIKDIWKIGDEGQYGYRMPGTPADWAGAEYVADKFAEFGLQTEIEDFFLPICFPDEWSLTISVNGVDESIPAGFVRYAKFTDGTSAPMVYVGTGTEEEFAAVDVAGKIAVVDLVAPGLPTAILGLFGMYTYDPENTLPGDKITENWPVDNFDSSYENAHLHDAVGFVGILTFTADNIHQYLHAYADGSLPGLYISPNDGARLREMLLDDQIVVDATMVLTGEESLSGTSKNVYGILPGQTDEIIVVLSHHDGWATNEASGMAVVMGLAKYYSQIPLSQRQRTIMFLATASHFGKRPELLDMCEKFALVRDDVVAAISNLK